MARFGGLFDRGEALAPLLDARALFRGRRKDWEARCRALTFSARLSGDDVLCRALGRYTMLVDAGDVGLAPHLIADGFWEIWITRLIAQTVRPGMVCLDAGANLGYYSVLMADLVGPQGRLVAAEPFAANRRLLERNLHHHGFADRTQVVAAALGAATGQVRMVMPAGEPKNAHVGDVGDERVANGDYVRFDVAEITVDDLDLPRIDFAKIDVEGAEWRVWQGMQKTLDRSPGVRIVIEVNCRRYPQGVDFLETLERRFSLRTIDSHGRPRPISRQAVEDSPVDVMLYLS